MLTRRSRMGSAVLGGLLVQGTVIAVAPAPASSVLATSGVLATDRTSAAEPADDMAGFRNYRELAEVYSELARGTGAVEIIAVERTSVVSNRDPEHPRDEPALHLVLSDRLGEFSAMFLATAEQAILQVTAPNSAKAYGFRLDEPSGRYQYSKVLP